MSYIHDTCETSSLFKWEKFLQKDGEILELIIDKDGNLDIKEEDFLIFFENTPYFFMKNI